MLKTQDNPDGVSRATFDQMTAGLRPTLACAEAFATTDFRWDLVAFGVPTLIVHGTADKTVPIDTSARAPAKGIRDAALIEYDGALHGLAAGHKPQGPGDARPARLSARLAYGGIPGGERSPGMRARPNLKPRRCRRRSPPC